MSRAVSGAFEIAAGAAMLIVGAFFGLDTNPEWDELAAGLIIGGIATELSANPAMNLTVRQPAQYRRIIYGMQRVGSSTIYISTTGNSNGIYNLVLVLATHECWEISNLYLDGREVFFNTNSPNGRTQCPSGSYFGGYADGNDHIGPDGRRYNFSSNDVFCEARYGTQSNTDFMESLNANDGTWGPGASGVPYVGGCTYIYLKLYYNQNNFTQFPDIKVTLRGKLVLDPRTGETTYSSNPALIIADMLADPDYGLADSSVNQAQLIAAANICDEQVETATAGLETRYCAHYNYDTSTGVGDAITTIAASMGARFSRIGGEWYIFPAAFYGASISLGEDDVIATPNWSPVRKFRDLFNQVRGTYVAPNFPFNVLGDLYDSNGYFQGQTQNNFAYAFHQTNAPPYACDALHGFPADQYLAQDGGKRLTKELGLPAVLSITQWQRLAKIELLRNRWQGAGSFTFRPKAFQLQPCDTFNMAFAPRGWTNKLLEVNSFRWRLDTGRGAPEIQCQIGVNETDASIYEWDPATEENTIYDQPALPTQSSYTPDPPTNMQVTSLVYAQPDGTLLRMLQVTWNTPQDPRVSSIQCQFQVQPPAGQTGTWWDGGTVSVQSNALLLGNIVSGQTYNVRICSVRSSGSSSEWVEATGIATTSLSPVVYQGVGIAPEALTATGTTLTITPISTTLGSTPVSYFPGGKTVAGVQAGRTNYVYVVDPTYAGGDPTPVVTTNQADYLGRVGYVLLGTVS